MTYKTIKDIKFEEHPNPSHKGLQGVLDFENGYGVSVITTIPKDGKPFGGSYGGNAGLWEIGLRKHSSFHNESIGKFESGIIGWCNDSDVTEAMIFLQSL
jgi:hypothetical protein